MSSIDSDYYWDSVQVKVVIEGKAICHFIVLVFFLFDLRDTCTSICMNCTKRVKLKIIAKEIQYIYI